MTYVIVFLYALIVIGILAIPLLLIVRIFRALVSRKVREQIRKKKLLYVIWLAISTVIVLSLSIPSVDVHLRAAHIVKTAILINQVQTAIKNYQVEYNSLPSANDNASLIKILMGDNPRKIVFLSLHSRDIDAQGQMLDAWGTPFRMSMADPKHPVIQSAGPDKIWNTSDDMTGPKDEP